MNQVATKGVVIARTNFGEADRILTIITPDHGVISVIAKGVRKQKSKLAGGIELFSESDITYIKGRGEISTLISTRLIKHYSKITSEVNRTLLGYEFLKQTKAISSEHCEPDHYDLVATSLKWLNKTKIPINVTELWFFARLLWLDGRMPNLTSDKYGKNLSAGNAYNFNYESMCFEPSESGKLNASHIKLLRLSVAKTPSVLSKVIVDETRLNQTLGLIKSIFSYK